MSPEEYIERIKSLPPPRKTFMEIMKVHRSEVHIANLLAYFFRSEEKHGLGKIFLRALFETNSYYFKKTDENEGNESELFGHAYTLSPNDDRFKKTENQTTLNTFIERLSKIQVKTEDPTIKTEKKQKRIDLVLTTDECVVCIEFKINHELNNPLKVYQNHIRKMELEFQESGKGQRDLFFVVLSPYRKEPTESVQNFINQGENVFREMILSHFVKNVVKNIPGNYFIENVNNPYSQYLIDFIQTINNRANNHWRTKILADLQVHIKKNLSPDLKINTFDQGFIQIHYKTFIYKIRIKHNRQFVIEEWSKGKIYKLKKSYPPLELSNTDGYKAVLNSLKDILNNQSI